MSAIVQAASRAGAWIVADEIYQGAERVGQSTPSFWGRYERTAIVNGLSKAYGLPGLRIGWVVGPKEFILKTWPYHDYTTISPGFLSDRIARIALAPATREKILARTRSIIKSNFIPLESWLNKQAGLFSFLPPRAGAIAFARYNLPVNSTELVTRLIKEKSTLIVPGDHFEMDHYLRFGFGSEPGYLEKGLARVAELLQDLHTRGQ
jgi:aspartate/methionine/tyrosine aminotransferase